MARYLPYAYEPIPDALLWSKADLVDVTRRIARNQNWIWANHGNVIAAYGHEPMTAQAPSVASQTDAVDCAYFACPNRSATGSDSVRCRGYINDPQVFGFGAIVRLYQLLPGEAVPTSDTPYDETLVLGGAVTGDIFFDFTARIRSGADPLRFCLRLLGGPSLANTMTLLSCTVTWLPNPTSVLGETVAAWEAISQGYVTADRPLSAALLRALSNRTLRLMAENPRPIFAHSFIWPRISTAAAGAETRVALYTCKHDGLIVTPRIVVPLFWVLTGQNASVTYRVYVNGTLFRTTVATGTALVDNVYYSRSGTTGGAMGNVPSGDLKIEITAECTVGATAPPTYCTNMGCALIHAHVRQDVRTATDLGLPGADTVPAAYQPLDDNACAPGRSVVAQDDRLGRRAGPYYLVRNLIWLAANRTGHVLVADWLHRTQSAGWTGAGDAVYRNTTLVGSNLVFPHDLDQVPFADRAGPTNISSIPTGHHFRGDVLALVSVVPMSGGKIIAIVRPEVMYIPDAPGVAEGGELLPRLGSTLEGTFDVRPGEVLNGFQTQGPYYASYTPGDVFSIRGRARDQTRPPRQWALSAGMEIALHSAYVYESPLTQGDLDALA